MEKQKETTDNKLIKYEEIIKYSNDLKSKLTKKQRDKRERQERKPKPFGKSPFE